MQKQLQALVGKLKKIKAYAHNPDTVPWIESELEAILSSEPPVVGVRPGWVCKDKDKIAWCAIKPEFPESVGIWICFNRGVILNQAICDPWPNQQFGGPECIMEVK